MPRAGCLWLNDRVVSSPPDRAGFDEALAQGSDYLKQGKLDQAQRSFRMALEYDRDNQRVLALLGLTYFRGNQFDDARPIYEHLVELAPTDPSHRLNLGLVYLKVNESDKAISSLEASRALDPSQGRATSYLGLAYARSGRYAEAYRSFLLAGQNELASEIEINLTTAERDGINSQLGRSPSGPIAATPAPAVARTQTPASIPRTQTPARAKPPSAPPKPARPPAQEAHDASAAAAEDPHQLSHPEIVIEKLTASSPSVPMVPVRSGASIPDAPPTPIALFTDSMQFVLPKADGVPQAPQPGISMISQAVAAAAPLAAASTSERTKAGGTPPRPLSELATDELVRPDDGDDPFEIAPNGALIIRVTDRVLTRLDGVHVTGGDLNYEIAMRRSRGHQTDERFDYGGSPLHAVTGDGYLIAVPGKQTFHAVVLDDDILYLREDLVFAFEGSLRWESGNVPGLRGKLPVVQFRGDGALALRVARPLVRVKLPAQGVVYVDADRLAGWIGRVIPRAVVPPSGGPMGLMCVECTGEGIVLVEPQPDRDVVAAPQPVVVVTPPPRAKPPTPPPAAPPELDPDLDMSSVTGDDPADDPNRPSDAVAAAAAEGPSGDPEAAIDALDRIDEM